MENKENIATEIICRRRIKEIRLEHGLSMEEFGKIVGVGKATVSRWESNNVAQIKTSDIYTISNYFNVSPVWVLGYDAPKEKKTKAEQQEMNNISNKLIWLSYDELVKLSSFIDNFLLNKKKEV